MKFQDKIGIIWGKLILSLSQIGVILSSITMILAGIAATPVIQEWALRIGIQLKLWHIAVVIIIIILLMLFIVNKMGTKNYLNQLGLGINIKTKEQLDRMEKKLDDFIKNNNKSK